MRRSLARATSFRYSPSRPPGTPAARSRSTSARRSAPGDGLRAGQGGEVRHDAHFTYTCTPLFPANGDAAELPYFSFVEQIRPGAGVVLDRMAVGCVVEGWTISIGSGPGRANSKITVEFAGSGKLTEPSGITMPGATLEKLLPSASLALSVNGVNYVSNKNIVSLETSWKNNIRTDAGFYPGSGFQTPGDATSAPSGDGWSRQSAGRAAVYCTFENGSTELTKLKGQTTGTAVLSLTYDANNSLEITGRRSPLPRQRWERQTGSSRWRWSVCRCGTPRTASSPRSPSAAWTVSASSATSANIAEVI